jgi:hypothetical protein
MRLKTALLIILFLIACGKRGDPVAPVPVIPKATGDLAASQRGDVVELSWSYPALTAAGESLKNVSRIIVYRYVEGLPATLSGKDPSILSPGETDPGTPPAIALFKSVPALTPEQFAKLKVQLDTLNATAIPTYTVGARVLYSDHPPATTADGRPVRVTYAVVTTTSSGTSELSNLASIIPLVPPNMPTSLTAKATPEAIVLTWKDAAKREGAFIAGYNIYRFPPDGPIDELGTPVNPTPVTTTTFSDTPAYGSYRYIMTTVASAGPPLVQSEPASSVLAEFKDLMPPAAPANVATLVEANAVRLVWDAVDAPDLAGYKVYRSAGDDRVALTPASITDTNYRDASMKLGISYVYSVTSLDTHGNESAASAAPAIIVAK